MADFHGDQHYKMLMKRIVDQVKPQTVIETGTYEGDTTRAFAKWVPHVSTIEIREDFRRKAIEDGIGHDNITYYLGSSSELLYRVMLDCKETPTLFFLDAHWQDVWPLFKELEDIAYERRLSGLRTVTVIDDFSHPTRKNFFGCNGGGGTIGDARYGPRTKVDDTPCDINTFGQYLEDYQELWFPCYDGSWPGYAIASDFKLDLSPIAEKYNFETKQCEKV